MDAGIILCLCLPTYKSVFLPYPNPKLIEMLGTCLTSRFCFRDVIERVTVIFGDFETLIFAKGPMVFGSGGVDWGFEDVGCVDT